MSEQRDKGIEISLKGRPCYKVLPHGKGDALCYEIFKWRKEYQDEKGIHHEGMWKTTGKYPVTMSGALFSISKMVEKNVMFGKKEFDDLVSAAESFEKILNNFNLTLIDIDKK